MEDIRLLRFDDLGNTFCQRLYHLPLVEYRQP